MSKCGGCSGAPKAHGQGRWPKAIALPRGWSAVVRSIAVVVRPPNTRMKLTRRPRVAKSRLGDRGGDPSNQQSGTGRSLRSLGAQLMRHPLGACLTLDGARRAGLSSRPRLRAVAWSAWCAAEGGGREVVATSVATTARRAPARCGPTSSAGGSEPQCGGWWSTATRRVMCRPARRLNLRRSGARVAKWEDNLKCAPAGASRGRGLRASWRHRGV
jgi:hypothetical protein